MRFESKHQYFKKMASKQNFLNLSKSLASRYQTYECVSQVGNPSHHPLFSSELNAGPSVILSQTELDHLKMQMSFSSDDLDEVKVAYSSKHVTVCGTKYVVSKSFLLVGADANMRPEFGLLKKIYIVKSSEVYFEIEMLETLQFEENLQAYIVQKPTLAQGYEFCAQHKLMDHNCYSLIIVDGVSYIPIEFDIDDLIDLHMQA